MDRYRSYGQNDDQPAQVGDNSLLGVDEYNAPENIKPGNVQNAVNVDFSPQDATTRGGFVCLPELGAQPFGQVWTYHAMGGSSSFRDVSYGQNLFVAVGLGGVIKTSPDGVTWTSRTASVAANWNDIAYANGKFVAVGGTSAGVNEPVTLSTDGVTWTNPTTPFTGAMNGVSFGNDIWVAVGSQVSAVSTDNGNTWTKYTGISSLAIAQGLSYGNGVFFAAGFGGVITSPDGVTWTERTISGSGIFADVAFGNQIFVALDFNGRIFTSTDSITWTQQRQNDDDDWRSLVYGNGMFVAFADTAGGDGAMYSIDGVTWTKLTGVPNYAWYGSTFGDGKFVVVGDASASMSATNISQAIYASGLFSDPNQPSEVWTMLVAYDKVGFYASGRTGRSISFDAGEYVTQQSTIVQANNQVYLFRGQGQTPLYWDGNWNGTFVLVPDTNLPDSYNSIPNSNYAVYYQDRLWVVDGKDQVAASDILEFTTYDPIANEKTINAGNSDYIVAAFPFGLNSLVVFKNKSIWLLQNCEGSLPDVTATEITRQVGLIGINAVCSVGPDLAYASYGNINLLTLTSTNNSLQHKTLPLSAKVKKIMDRVNWEVGYKISMGYWSNKLYVALPLDNSTYCNGVIVYNFITENWYGEWNFNASMNMCIQGWQVLDYLGLQRLHAITEDGRIFVTDEGYQDISGSTLAEISYNLTTRAYDTSNLVHFQRRMFMDIGTIRPSFSVYSYTEGANEVSTLIEDQTYSRSESWKFNDSAYDLTNANDDYNRPYRKDYSSGPLAAGSTSGLPTTGLQCGSGFQPEMYQEYRFPLLTRRQGRLTWLQLTNSQGYLKLMSIGAEARMGQRSSLVTV